MPSPVPPRTEPPRPMWLLTGVIATVAVAAVFAVDQFADVDGTTRAALRVLAVAGAAAAAGTFFQRWSTVPVRAVPHHVMAALGLLGGALVASSAFATGDAVFGNAVTAALGLVSLVVSLFAARISLAHSSGVHR